MFFMSDKIVFRALVAEMILLTAHRLPPTTPLKHLK